MKNLFKNSWEFTKRTSKNTAVGTVNLSRVTGATFKSSISITSMLIALFIGFLPLIPLFAMKNSEGAILILRVVSMSVTFALMYRSFKALNDNSTLDKNRATYLIYDEKKILFAKLLTDVFMFLLSTALTIILAPIIVIYIKGGVMTSTEIFNLFYYMIAMLVLYLLISFGLRFFDSIFRLRKQKYIALSIWSILTVLNFLVMSGVVGSVKELGMWVHDNKYVVAFTPFLNILTPSAIISPLHPTSLPPMPAGALSPGSIQNLLHSFSSGTSGMKEAILPAWTVAPLIGETFIFTIISWKFASKAVKEHLCG